MPPKLHSSLGASAAERWLNCPPSARLAEQFPDTGSSSAAEGTLAHAIAELKANKLFTVMSKRTYNSQLKKLQADPVYDKEMEEHTDAYVEFLREKAMMFSEKPFVATEVRVDYAHVAPGGFGTCDCVMIGGGFIQIVDFKYGKSPNGRVQAENNPQMMLYALGALNAFRLVYGDSIRTARLSIFQPRLDNGVSEWEIPVPGLNNWAENYVRPRAELADKGEGAFAPGDWCHFCPAKAQCRARAEAMLGLEQQYEYQKPPLLSDTEVGEALIKAEGLTAWAGALKEYALQACLDGKDIPGWKAVEGTSRRQWENTDDAIAALIAHGIDEAILYERVPVTAPKAGKALGKKVFDEIAAPLVVKPRGKPALVQAGDKRPPYNAAEIAFGKENNP